MRDTLHGRLGPNGRNSERWKRDLEVSTWISKSAQERRGVWFHVPMLACASVIAVRRLASRHCSTVVQLVGFEVFV
jgi:hypothetical protein